jgi:gliding motility-associated-like protein
MKKIYFLVFLVISTIYAVAQNNAGCPNANFSSSNFANWQGYTGNYTNPASAFGIVNGRHTIITTPGIDPNTCGGLQLIPPGSTRSARLGNQSTGAQGERLTYTLNVTAQNSLFIYKYACVLQDPGHSPAQQPVFQMRLLNQNGTQIGGNCGAYTVYAGQPGQNFQTCGSVKWLPWTIVGVNLQAYIGQNVTIEFTTKDCSLSGHYGYAYVVADCMPLTLDLDYCFGSPTINISGPAGFQSYNWSNGANTQSISVPAATAAPSYTVTMQSFSNQGSCTVALTASAIPTTVQSNFTHTSACPWAPMQFNSTPTILPNTINGVALANGGASSWSWNFGDGSTLNGNNPAVHMNPTHTYQNPGTYNVTHIVTTQAGCSDTISQTITVLPPPVINFSFNNSCMNDTVSFTNQTQDPNLAQVTYTWLFGNGSPNSTQTNPVQIYPNAGTYNVSLIASNAGGCTDTLTQAVTVYPLPPVNAGSNVSVCPGTQVTLNATGAPTLTWETGTANGGTYLPANSTTLTVVGIDNNGCLNQDSMDITIFPGALVNAGPDINVCLGSTVTITATGSNTYQWNNGITNGQTFTPPLGTTTYTVIGTSVNGCTNVDSMVLTVFSNPGISAGVDQIVCQGDSIQLFGQGAVSYQWSGGITNGSFFTPLSTGLWSVSGLDTNGCIGYDTMQITIPQPTVFAGNDTSICPGFSIPLNAVGTATYTWSTGTLNGNNYSPLSNEILTVVGLDTNLCPAYDTLTVTVFQAPVVDAGPDIQVCSGTQVTISGSGAVSYVWDNGLINGNTWTPPVGIITYHVIGTDANGCIDTSNMILTVWANPTVNAGVDQSICEGSSTQVSGSGAVSYQWNNGILNQVNFTPINTLSYTVIGTDQNGCIGSDNMNITIEPAAIPNFSANITEDCIPFTSNLTNTSTGTPYLSAAWDFGNGVTQNDLNSTSVTYNAQGCYDVSLTLTTALGCVWDTTFTDYLCAYPVPIADFNVTPQSMTVLNTTGTFENYSSGADYYDWDFGDGSTNSSEFEPIHAFPTSAAGTYLISLIASTEFGCQDTATRTVIVLESQLIFVPNTFTPDGNEYNQTWLPIITADFDPYEYSCFIYNRWGEIIWENHNHEMGWDGKRADGIDVTQGTYSWKIILKSPYSDNRKAYTGHVNLIR